MESKMKTLHRLVIWLVCCNVNDGINRFYVETDLEMQTYMSVYNDSSSLQCGRYCLDTDGCVSFGITASTKMCKLFNTDPLIAASDSRTAIGSNIYIIGKERSTS